MSVTHKITESEKALVDSFGRRVSYLRLSVTDRCDFRCTYCMAEQMDFLPRSELLSFEELELISARFIARGVTKIRISGGEPLVRKGVMDLFERLSAYFGRGLEELTLTTNGSQLPKYAADLKKLGVKRVNISLDTLDADRFAALTRIGRIEQTLDGIDAALDAGLKVKLNTVAMAGINEHEIETLIRFAHARGMSLSLIETMPLGEVETDREADFLPLSVVRDRLAEAFTLTPLEMSTGGPARYVQVEQTGGVLGFISPLTQNFCAGCNRVRLTCTGQLYLCLGQNDAVDFRTAVRGDDPLQAVDAALDRAMINKPEAHDFRMDRMAVPRSMSMTGG